MPTMISRFYQTLLFCLPGLMAVSSLYAQTAGPETGTKASQNPAPNPSSSAPATTGAPSSNLTPRITGRLQDPSLDEVSGISASRLHPGTLYVHNDSGDTSRFFAINAEGRVLATYYFHGLERGKGVQDCEDIAVGAGEKAGRQYVYIGDIGDNRARRKCITIYRVKEPDQHTSDGNNSSIPVESSTLRLVYPDGPRDAETLMVDPIDKLLYIISKREDSVGIYTAPWRFPGKKAKHGRPHAGQAGETGNAADARNTAEAGDAGEPVVLQKRATLYIPGQRPMKFITAGDISADGSRVLLKSYTGVYYWKRKGREPLWQVLKTPARELPYTREKQGEAIGFTPDGKAYYTTSEGTNAPIYYYQINIP